MSMIDDLIAAASQREQPLQTTPSVGELTVTAPPRQPSQQVQMAPQDTPQLAPPMTAPDFGASQDRQNPTINYNNSGSVDALNSAMQGEPPLRGGMANPGLYGMLPAGLQHGTLRNVLGALGDAFLVGSGRQAQYEPRMQRQEIGQAMAGYNPDDPGSVQAAIQRVAATGATGSTEMADQLQKNFNDIQLRRQMQEQNNWYRQSTIDARHDNLYNRIAPMAQADLSQATSQADYATRLARWDARIKGIDSNSDAVTALGVPDAGAAPAAGATSTWANPLTSTAGMTNQQITQHQDRQATVQAGERNTDVRAGATISAARIGAASRIQSAMTSAGRTTDATIMQGLIDKANTGQAFSPIEQQFWDHYTAIPHNSRRPAPTTGAHPGAGGGPPVLTPQQAAQAPKGTVFRTTDGRTLVR